MEGVRRWKKMDVGAVFAEMRSYSGAGIMHTTEIRASIAERRTTMSSPDHARHYSPTQATERGEKMTWRMSITLAILSAIVALGFWASRSKNEDAYYRVAQCSVGLFALNGVVWLIWLAKEIR